MNTEHGMLYLCIIQLQLCMNRLNYKLVANLHRIKVCVTPRMSVCTVALERR